MKKALFIILFFVAILPNSVFATMRYINPVAGGTGSGLSWTDAYTSIPATLNRGDTYYIAEGSYGAVVFNTAVSGENYIYIKKCGPADLVCTAAAGYNAAHHNGQAGFTNIEFRTAYWDIDGATGSGNSGHGILVYTDGGYYGAVVTYNSYAAAIHHIRLRHMEIKSVTPTGARDGIYFWASDSYGSYSDWNFIVEYCYIHGQGGLHVHMLGGRYWLFQYNYFENCCQYNDAGHKEMFKDDSFTADVTIRYNTFKDWGG